MKFFGIAAAMLTAAAAFAADAPRVSADSLMETARAEAARSHRAIWMMFDASW